MAIRRVLVYIQVGSLRLYKNQCEALDIITIEKRAYHQLKELHIIKTIVLHIIKPQGYTRLRVMIYKGANAFDDIHAVGVMICQTLRFG